MTWYAETDAKVMKGEEIFPTGFGWQIRMKIMNNLPRFSFSLLFRHFYAPKYFCKIFPGRVKPFKG